MGVVTIKAGKIREKRQQVIRKARATATNLLEVNADRVLVVYGQEDVNVYYEQEPAPRRS